MFKIFFICIFVLLLLNLSCSQNVTKEEEQGEIKHKISAQNQAPVVDIEDEMTVHVGDEVLLVGNVDDDGLPGAEMIFLWLKLEGADAVSFPNGNQEKETTVIFSQPGEYLIAFGAFDGELLGYDIMKVIVEGEIEQADTVAEELVRIGKYDQLNLDRWKDLLDIDNAKIAWRDRVKQFLEKYNGHTPINVITGCDQEFGGQYTYKTVYYDDEAYNGNWRNRKNSGSAYIKTYENGVVVTKKILNVGALGGHMFSYEFLVDVLEFLHAAMPNDPVVKEFKTFMINASWQWSTVIKNHKYSHYGEPLSEEEHYFETAGEGQPLAIQETTKDEREQVGVIFEPPIYIYSCKFDEEQGLWVPQLKLNGGDSDTRRHENWGGIAKAAASPLLGGSNPKLQKQLIFLLEGKDLGDGKYYAGLAKKILSTTQGGLLDVEPWVNDQFTRSMSKHFHRTIFDLVQMAKFLKDIKPSLALRARNTLVEILIELVNKYPMMTRTGFANQIYSYPWLPRHPVDVLFNKWPYGKATPENPEPSRLFVLNGGFWDWNWKFALIYVLDILDPSDADEEKIISYIKEASRQVSHRIVQRKNSPPVVKFYENKGPELIYSGDKDPQGNPIPLQNANARGGYLGHFTDEEVGTVLLRSHYGSPEGAGGLRPYEYKDKLYYADPDIGQNFLKAFYEDQNYQEPLTCLVLMEETLPYMGTDILVYPEGHGKVGLPYYIDKQGNEVDKTHPDAHVVYTGSNTPSRNENGLHYPGFPTMPRGNEGVLEVDLLLNSIVNEKNDRAINTALFMSACRLSNQFVQLKVGRVGDFKNLQFKAGDLSNSPLNTREEYYKLMLMSLFLKEGGTIKDALMNIIKKFNN